MLRITNVYASDGLSPNELDVDFKGDNGTTNLYLTYTTSTGETGRHNISGSITDPDEDYGTFVVLPQSDNVTLVLHGTLNGISVTSEQYKYDIVRPKITAEITSYNNSTNVTVHVESDIRCNSWEVSKNFGEYAVLSTVNDTIRNLTVTSLTANTVNTISVRARKTNAVSDTTYGFSQMLYADMRVPSITLELGERKTNSIWINATSNIECRNWQYSVDNGSTWTTFKTGVWSSVGYNITGLSPSHTYTIKVRAENAVNTLIGTSSAKSYTTLGQSTIVSTTAFFADDTTVRIPIQWNVNSTAFTHSIAVKNGSTTLFTITGLTASQTGTSQKILTLTAQQRTAILNSFPNSTSATLTLVLTTYDNGTALPTTSSKAIKANVREEKSRPTFSDFAYADVNSTTVALTGDNQKLIQNKSNLRIICVAASGVNGATIAKYRAKVGEKTVESTTTTINFGAIEISGDDIAIQVEAIDSRGFTYPILYFAEVYPYENVNFSTYEIRRLNGVEAQTSLSITGVYSKLILSGSTDSNSIKSLNYRYKKTTETDYGEWHSVLSGATQGNGEFSYSNSSWLSFDTKYSYNIQLFVADELSNTTISVILSTGTPIVALRKDKVGIMTNNPQFTADVNGNIGQNGKGIMGYVNESVTNLNNINTPGYYFCEANTTNAPSSQAGLLEVLPMSTGSHYLQRYTARASSAYYGLWIRVYINGSWSDWKKVTLT